MSPATSLALALALGALFLLGLGLAMRTGLMLRRVTRTRAKVVGSETSRAGGEARGKPSATVYYFTVEFADRANRKRRAPLAQGLDGAAGDKLVDEANTIAILYDPRQPGTAQLDPGFRLYLPALLCMAPGVLFALAVGLARVVPGIL